MESGGFGGFEDLGSGNLNEECCTGATSGAEDLMTGGVSCELDGLKKSLIDLLPDITETIYAGRDSNRI
jgi:hypothetical protein